MAERYRLEDRLEAAIAWLITGSSREAAEICTSGVSDRTIRLWRTEPWWETVLEEAKTAKQAELDALYTGVIHKTMDRLREVVRDGDTVLVAKTGATIKIPVKAKDLAFIASILADKRSILRGQATKITKNISVQETLNKLTEGFKDIDEQTRGTSRPH